MLLKKHGCSFNTKEFKIKHVDIIKKASSASITYKAKAQFDIVNSQGKKIILELDG